MLVQILSIHGVQKLNRKDLQQTKGGEINDPNSNHTYYCWDDKGDFESSIDVSGNGVHCSPVAVIETASTSNSHQHFNPNGL